MARFPEITSWLTIDKSSGAKGHYEHALGQENGGDRSKILPSLKSLMSEAHDDARSRLRRLAANTLSPFSGSVPAKDPAEGYPQRLHIQTLKGYFGEALAGAIAENFQPFGKDDWKVPAFLFRYHTVAFQHLELLKQTGEPAKMLPGRTGDDCLAFRRTEAGKIVAALFCEAKCTADHSSKLINDAHEKSSLRNVIPVDLLQLVEILKDSSASDAAKWIESLQELQLKGADSGYERLDHVTYICGQKPKKNGKSWIPADKPHEKYTGGRKLHVAEIQLSDVEKLIKDAYGVV
jgi:hypothetical protein